ncbi:MAG: sulfurtransferase [Reichenbachiella sp.]
MAYSNFLVKPKWLHEHSKDDNLVIIDCQWDINAFLRAHIPGSIMRPGHPYVKSEKDGKPTKYLPTEQEFSILMAQLGIDNETQVVCYDEWDNHFATRFWWVLSYYGHTKTRLLDGGWQAWVDSGLPVSYKGSKPQVQKKGFIVDQNNKLKVDMAEVLASHHKPEWQILDVRSKEEFEGQNLSGNKRGGHIKGAIHLEWKKMLVQSGLSEGANYFGSEEEMLALLDGVGLVKEKTVVVHCQSGVRASLMVFCLEMLGYSDVRLYDGSMSEWANEDHMPLEI